MKQSFLKFMALALVALLSFSIQAQAQGFLNGL